MEKAIPLKQRGMEAIEGQMQWMIKVYGYTPMLATRDALQKSAADAARRLKAGRNRVGVLIHSRGSTALSITMVNVMR